VLPNALPFPSVESVLYVTVPASPRFAAFTNGLIAPLLIAYLAQALCRPQRRLWPLRPRHCAGLQHPAGPWDQDTPGLFAPGCLGVVSKMETSAFLVGVDRRGDGILPIIVKRPNADKNANKAPMSAMPTASCSLRDKLIRGVSSPQHITDFSLFYY
jgi:hypothetical protein